MKSDTGKRRYDLLPPGALSRVVDVLTHGTKHDKPRARIPGFMRIPIGQGRRLYTAALMRHFEAWRAGEILDPDSHLPHLAHVTANALILLALEIRSCRD